MQRLSFPLGEAHRHRFHHLCALLLTLGLIFAAKSHADAPVVLSGGFNHFCALTKTDGQVRCWGNKNISGVATSGTTVNGVYPALAIDNIVTLGAGNRHVCALRNDGVVLCWGDNLYNVVGSADSSNRAILVPQVLNGLGGLAIEVASGAFSDHACAITTSFEAKCWGRNGSGQLGNGNFTTTPNPQAVANLGAVNAIATGTDHTCAIGLSGAVKCWGFGGLIGDGTGSSRASPTQVTGIDSGAVAVSAGFQHTCALLNTGRVKCWGNNSRGQLGNGTTLGALSPVEVTGISDAIAVTVGRDYSCALRSNGAVSCWGSRQQAGGPDGVAWTAATLNQTTPINVVGLSAPAVSIGSSSGYACASVVDGQVECWGTNILPSGVANESRATAHLGGFAIDTRLVMSESRHVSLDYFFMTSSFQEKHFLKALVPEFQPTGRSFAVYPTGLQASSKPLTRFYFSQIAKSGSRGSHFYTLVDIERSALIGANPSNANTPRQPQNDGTDSFAFAPAVEGVGGSCAAGQIPVYRAFRGNARFPDDPNHRFTIDATLYNSLVSQGWDGEGVKLCTTALN
jgi:hypothetical protein